jgi:uncharacterized membrane protein YqhA
MSSKQAKRLRVRHPEATVFGESQQRTAINLGDKLIKSIIVVLPIPILECIVAFAVLSNLQDSFVVALEQCFPELEARSKKKPTT